MDHPTRQANAFSIGVDSLINFLNIDADADNIQLADLPRLFSPADLCGTITDRCIRLDVGRSVVVLPVASVGQTDCYWRANEM